MTTKQVYLSTYAANYPRKYGTDQDEIAAAIAKRWTPSSVDFLAAAQRQPPVLGVANFLGIIDAIRSYKTLTRVNWYGHGSAKSGFLFGEGQSFGAEELKDLVKKKVDIDVSAQFDKSSSVWFYACNCAINEDFIQNLANAMQVRVYAFNKRLEWTLDWNDKNRITYRGMAKTIPSPFYKDPAAKQAQPNPKPAAPSQPRR